MKAKRTKDASIKAKDPSKVLRISIEGFKSIAKQTLELGRLNVLIGANGAGKTAVLEAVGLLGAAANGRVDIGELSRRGVRPSAPRLFTTALRNTVATEIRLEAESEANVHYTVTLRPPGPKRSPLWRFHAESVLVGSKAILRRQESKVEVKNRAGRWQSIQDFGPGVGSAAKAMGLDGEAMRRFFFSLADIAIYDPKTPPLRGMALDPFDREPLGLHGGGLAKAMKAVQTEQGGLGAIDRDELLSLLHWAAGVEVGPPDLDTAAPSVPMTTEIVRFIDKHITAGRNMISAFDASEGALYVLFALTLLFHPDGPRLLGIEGLDHALHPRLARALMRTLGTHIGATHKQILLTTHNPLVLDGLELANDDIRLFTVDRDRAGSTFIRRVEYTEALQKAQESGATLSQMWLQGLLGAVPALW